jgi:hypothetical protein
MPEITLTDDQARELIKAREKVILRNPEGEMIGVIDPIDAMALAEHRKRAGQPREPGITAEQADRELELLQAEWDRTGGFDDEYMEAFLQRARESGQI